MWGEQAVGGFFEDVHVLIVVVIGMSILLGTFAAAFLAYDAARRRTDLRADAAEALRSLLEGGPLLHGGDPRLLDHEALMGLDGAILAAIVGPDHRAQVVVAERSGTAPEMFMASTGPLGEERVVASTAASVWHSDLDVRAARVTLTLGG